MNSLRKVLLAIKSELGGEGDVAYVKAADLDATAGIGVREVGSRMAYIRENDDIPVDVSRWSYTGSATTYRIEVPDWEVFCLYITDLRGKPEPCLSVSG